ncbi:MAG TPA: YidB family protein [Pyrinomonadaceae bacterium]|nr:YidB family protein [Pyrinomonadaceae bacterium]
MALFDSVIAEAKERFGLSTEKAGALVAALLGLITDPKSGGFGGFVNKFDNAGLGDTVRSWITTGDNTPLSNEQLESALGEGTITSVANQNGVDRETATTALAGMIPTVVDDLTPDGDIPEESSLLSKIGGFLSDWGGTIGGAAAGAVGAAGAFTGNVVDRVDAAAEATYTKGKDALKGGIGAATGATGAVGDRVSGAMSNARGDSNGVMRWLLPLIILALLVILGFWFCGRSTTPTAPTNVNINTNRASNKTNAVTNSSPSANAEGAKNLSELVLPNGRKLQAYPGGIEDQLVKFIQSDEYKNATNDQLKDKWFNFDDLNFAFGKTDLTPESQRQLDNIASILRAFPDVKIKIGAYSDKKGDDAANLKLSDSRAKAVQAALQKAGVGSQVPEAEGYGEKFATVDENASDEERKADRKTAIRLIK